MDQKPGNDEDSKTFLRELNERLGQEEKAGNDKFFDDYLSDYLVFRRARGKIVGKREFRKGLDPNQFEELKTHVDHVDVQGESAVVDVTVTSKRKGEEKAGRYRNIRVFRRVEGPEEWELIAWVNTEIKDPE